MAKQNCWELMRCGREPGGERAQELGVCPSATDTRFHGLNGGENAGRCCWVVAGTFCEGEPNGYFVDKWTGCAECAVFRSVKMEEGVDYVSSLELLKLLSDEEKQAAL